MSPEKTQELFELCPNLYKGKDEPLTQNLMSFGLECDDGWFDLIKHLSIQLEKLAETVPVKAVQVKEKFGTLRFYLSYYNEEIDKLVEEAEKASSITCELCGDTGELSHHGYWYKTLCKKCQAETGYEGN